MLRPPPIPTRTEPLCPSTTRFRSRYDRRVKQMGRAALLPVALAEAGKSAEAGTVYFVPPELSIEQDKTRILFVAGEGGSGPMLDVLPAGDSALLLLSGSSADCVDVAMAHVPAGLMVEIGRAHV